MPFFHDEAAANGLTQRGIRTPTHMWVLSQRAGAIWSTCHDVVADPYQRVPLADPALDRELAGQTRGLLSKLGMPWATLDMYLDESLPA